MYSSPNNITFGPFYLPDEERETKRKDKFVSLNDDKEKDMLKAELVTDLMETEWDLAEGEIIISRMLIRDLLQKKATLLGINTQKIVTHHLVPGCEEKGKGLLQILWEEVG